MLGKSLFFHFLSSLTMASLISRLLFLTCYLCRHLQEYSEQEESGPGQDHGGVVHDEIQQQHHT